MDVVYNSDRTKIFTQFEAVFYVLCRCVKNSFWAKLHVTPIGIVRDDMSCHQIYVRWAIGHSLVKTNNRNSFLKLFIKSAVDIAFCSSKTFA